MKAQRDHQKHPQKVKVLMIHKLDYIATYKHPQKLLKNDVIPRTKLNRERGSPKNSCPIFFAFYFLGIFIFEKLDWTILKRHYSILKKGVA